MDLLLLRRIDNHEGLARSSYQEEVTRSCRKEAMAVSVDAESGNNETNRSFDTVEVENVTRQMRSIITNPAEK